MLDVAIDVECRLAAHHVLRLRKNILDEGARHNAQGNFAVNPAERKVVDLVAKWRNVGSFSRVDIYGENVLAVEVDVGRQFKGKRGVAAFVLAELFAVDPDCRSRHHTFKIDEDVLSLGFRRQLESPAIDRNKLVVLVIEAVPGKSNICVWN